MVELSNKLVTTASAASGFARHPEVRQSSAGPKDLNFRIATDESLSASPFITSLFHYFIPFPPPRPLQAGLLVILRSGSLLPGRRISTAASPQPQPVNLQSHQLQSPPASPAKSAHSPAPCWSPDGSRQKIVHAPARPFPIPRYSSQKSVSAPHRSAKRPPSLTPSRCFESSAPSARQHRPRQRFSHPARSPSYPRR